jgi:hypothetical protein
LAELHLVLREHGWVPELVPGVLRWAWTHNECREMFETTRHSPTTFPCREIDVGHSLSRHTRGTLRRFKSPRSLEKRLKELDRRRPG